MKKKYNTQKKSITNKVLYSGGFTEECLRLLKINPLAKYIVQNTGKGKIFVNVYLNRLVKQGKIRRLDRGVYCITHKFELPPPSITNKSSTTQGQTGEKYWRLHNLMAWLRINSSIHKVIKSTILRNKQSFNVRSFGHVGQYFECEIDVMITRDNIFLKFPKDWEARFESKDELISGLYDIIQQVSVKLEQRFRIHFFKDGRINFNIRQIHIAYVEDGLSKELIKNDVNGVIVLDDDDGKRRFIIDWSHGLAEIEFVHPEKCLSDIELWQQFLKRLGNNEIEKLIDEHSDMKALLFTWDKIANMLVKRLIPDEQEEANPISKLDKPNYIG